MESNQIPTQCQDTQTPSSFVQKNHPENLILGDKNSNTQTRRELAVTTEHVNLSLLSKIDPTCFVETSVDQHLVNSMEE
jgi:hypothetical protein